MTNQRRLLLTCLAIEGTGLVLGLMIPPGEATLHGTLLLIATVILLLPGSILSVPLTTHILPRHIVQSQRLDSDINVITAVLLNCLLFCLVAAFLKRRTLKG
jgi:hypothetical protein